MHLLGLVVASLAALQSPPTGPAPDACSRALQWGADVAVGEICAGDEARRMASAAKTPRESAREITRAAEHYRRAAATSSIIEAQVLALTALAECYDAPHLNEPLQMEAALREIIRLAPANFAVVARLSALQEQSGLLEAAEGTLLESRRQHPDAIDPYRFLAQFYARRVTAMTAMTRDTATPATDPTSGPGEPDAAGVYRVGGSLPAPPRADVPQYPPEAQAAGIKGAVVAEVVIDQAGRVMDARVVQSIPLLDEAALKAVRAWQFAPSVINGQPVPVRMNVTVNFTLGADRPGAAKPAPR